MALPPTEIRYSKYAFYLIVAINIFIFVPMLFSLFAIRPSFLICVNYVVVMLVSFFVSRYFSQKVRSEVPMLVFESHALTINRRKTKTILWGEITEWKIKSDKGGDSLVIRTASGRTEVKLSLLNAKTKAIESLMSTYIREPGPHGVRR